ncbi:MAG: hypothetical protein P4L79_15295 [Legionella sp.]|uniref:hypothetical protein n=1 Tax=Legionella sp. TaxID=459 RepID=UPI00284E8783|nr:hypothetical protein [Legionella sp.]
MITDKIKKDINDEFSKLKDEFQVHLKPGFDVSQTKQFLQSHVPKEIVYKSEILLDTLLNFLMEDARSKIKIADVTMQNAFFDADFRKRIHEWANQLENKLELESDMVVYTFDPRLKQGLIASGITFVAGIGISLTLTSSVVRAIVSGIITMLLSALAFKIVYDKASPKARELVKRDIDKYRKTSQKQVAEWLEKVETAFENDFHDFCSTNGFELKEK